MTTHTIPGGITLPTRGIAFEAAVDVARTYGVNDDIARAAVSNMADGTSLLLVISGKLASGKDTVAPAVMDALGAVDREHHYYSKALKDELDQIIGIIRGWHDGLRPANLSPALRWELAKVIGTTMGFPNVQAQHYFAGEFTNQVLAVRTIHARSRTTVIRRALQRLGTDVRRSQDEDYWVKKTVQVALGTLAQGTSVFFTDVRFPNEVIAPRLGGFAVRLDVSDATQRARLIARDGLIADESALTHVSETALDDYPSFDARIDNNGALQVAVESAVAALRAHTSTAHAA